MILRSLFVAAVIGVVGLSLYLRVPGLKDRPLHNDEAVNTVKFDDLRTQGYFHYDPEEYHGPTLFYFTLPSAWLARQWTFAQTNEYTYRAIPIVFGVGLMLLTLVLRKDLGKSATLWTMLLMAVSPAFVFYSRYYIHEMVLIFSTGLAIAAGWRFLRSGKWGWACLAGAGVGLMYATKETWVLAVAAAGGAAAGTAIVNRFWPTHGARLTIAWKPFLGSIGVMLAVSALFFSSFGVRPSGLMDAVGAFKTYFHRGSSGGTHDHPAGWYIESISFFQYRKPDPAGGTALLPVTGYAASVRSWWEAVVRPAFDKSFKPKGAPAFSEGVLILLALLGLIVALTRRSKKVVASSGQEALPDPTLMRFLGLYTLFLTVGYSLIPYKTPWCLLGFFHGMILLGGCVIAIGIRHIPTIAAKMVLGLIVVLLTAQLTWQANLLNIAWKRQGVTGRQFAGRFHPYVYAHTSGDIYNLVERVHAIAGVVPGGQPSIKIITADCWPLPFYLRELKRVGYSRGIVNDPRYVLEGDIIVTSMELAPEVEKRLINEYHPEFAALRPGVLLQVYIRKPVWDLYLEMNQR